MDRGIIRSFVAEHMMSTVLLKCNVAPGMMTVGNYPVAPELQACKMFSRF